MRTDCFHPFGHQVLDPLGRRFRQGSPERPWVTVVGIVKDVRHNGIRAPIKEKFGSSSVAASGSLSPVS